MIILSTNISIDTDIVIRFLLLYCSAKYTLTCACVSYRAHYIGIKVFLDVVTHGVTFNAFVDPLNASAGTEPNPFIAVYRDFFFQASYPNGSGSGKWLMTDYNYAHESFISWYL